jgi:hypothetical protein
MTTTLMTLWLLSGLVIQREVTLEQCATIAGALASDGVVAVYDEEENRLLGRAWRVECVCASGDDINS